MSDCLRGRPLPPAEVVRYGIAVADALRDIHERYVYGCLTPAGILLTDTGVELAPPHRRPAISPYAAPEQLRGEYDDPRSDIFTLGAILYEMATGRRAFESRDVEDLRIAILEHDLPPLDGIPPRLARVVRTCVEKRPQRRFQRAQLLAAQLKLIAASLRGPVLPESYVDLLPGRPATALSNGHTPPEPARLPAPEAVVRPRGKRLKCPKCKATDVRPSRPKDAWEDRLAEFGVKFNRCYRCYHRFLRIAFLAVSLDD